MRPPTVTREKVIALLEKGEMTMMDLREALGCSAPPVRKALKPLLEAGEIFRQLEVLPHGIRRWIYSLDEKYSPEGVSTSPEQAASKALSGDYPEDAEVFMWGLFFKRHPKGVMRWVNDEWHLFKPKDPQEFEEAIREHLQYMPLWFLKKRGLKMV